MTVLELLCKMVSSILPALIAAVLIGFDMIELYISLKRLLMPCTGNKASINDGQCNRSTLCAYFLRSLVSKQKQARLPLGTFQGEHFNLHFFFFAFFSRAYLPERLLHFLLSTVAIIYNKQVNKGSDPWLVLITRIYIMRLPLS